MAGCSSFSQLRGSLLLTGWSLTLAAGMACFVRPLLGKTTDVVSSELGQKVNRLIAELDAEKRSTRAAAREALLGLGPSILPLLPDDKAVTSPAIRDAVRQIRTRLERQSALATLAPSHVTLRGRMPLGEILKRISIQTGNQFDLERLNAPTLQRELSIDETSRTFWSTCDALILAAGLKYGDVHMRRTLKLVPARELRDGGELAVDSSGAFRVAVRSAELRPAFGAARQLLRINWSLLAEPRLRPLFAKIDADRLIVRDSTGAVLKPVSSHAKWEISMDESVQSLRLDTDFECAADARPRTIEFRGSLHVEMAAGPQRFVFDNLNADHRETQRAGGVTVGLKHVELPTNDKRDAARIEISLAYDQGGPAFESFRTWMYRNEAFLEAKDGRRMRPGPVVSTRQQGDGSVAVEYNFADVNDVPRDERFIYVAPTLITEMPVDFQLTGIPVATATPAARKLR